MYCPRCYGKVNKATQRCEYCGMRMKELKGATNAEAKVALKTIYKDDVMMTKVLPSDLKKSTILLLAIFLGIFGVHNFYVGRKWRGIFQVASLTLLFATYLLEMLVFANITGNYAWIFQLLFGISLIFWLYDVVCIIINQYKVPIYKIEFSRKY